MNQIQATGWVGGWDETVGKLTSFLINSHCNFNIGLGSPFPSLLFSPLSVIPSLIIQAVSLGAHSDTFSFGRLQKTPMSPDRSKQSPIVPLTETGPVDEKRALLIPWSPLLQEAHFPSRLDIQALVPACQSPSNCWHLWKDQQRVNADSSTGGCHSSNSCRFTHTCKC